jgi:hypothetical protein
MPYYTRSYNPNVGVSNPLYTIPRVQEVNQKDAELAFNEQEMAAYLAAEAARNPNFVLDRNAAAKQRYDAMVARNKRLNEDPTFQPGVGVPQPITNVTEVGPAGYQPPKPLPPLSTMEVSAPAYQPGYQGGLDFANPPDNKYGKSLLDGIKQGSKAAIDQKQGLLSQQQPPQEQGFFGNIGEYINEDFLGRVLAIMARPEAFTDPRGLGAGIARAGQAVFAQEKEQAAAKAKAQLEYDKLQASLKEAQIKAGGDKKLTDTVYKTIEKTSAASRGMQSINAYREILSSGPTGGIGGKFEKTIDRLAGLFNLGDGTTADKAQNLRQQILVDLEEALGRNNLNATEVKEAVKVLSDPDSWTKSNQKLKNELDIVFKKLKSIQATGANTLDYFGYDTGAFDPNKLRRPLHTSTRPSNR